MKGVKKVVKVGDTAVAVVADTWWHAKTALDALPIVWDEGENAKVSSASIAKWLSEGLDGGAGLCRQPERRRQGRARGAAKKVEAVYNYPYQNHATMEPMNATALYTPDKCEVWCGTQNGEAAFAAVLEASGLPADKCDVHKLMLGGGFGRRGQTDYVRQAVLIAKQMPGTPIKLLWSREEDMTHGRYHPITQCKMTGGFDADNNLTALHYAHFRPVDPVHAAAGGAGQRHGSRRPSRASTQAGEAAFGYSVPNLLIDHAMRNPHVPPGFWRGVNVNHNAIYVECFMDELAHAAGQDPLEFRRKLMRQPSEASRGAQCRGREDRLGQAGAAGRLSRPRAVHGLWQLCRRRRRNLGDRRQQDQGAPHRRRHRSRLRRQSGADRAADRRLLRLRPLRRCSTAAAPSRTARIEQTNFDTYNSMRINEMPKVESIVMPSGGFWGGVGEPTICVAATGGAQRLFRGDRQAHPLGAAARPEHHLRLRHGRGGCNGRRAIFLDDAHDRAPGDTARCRSRHHRIRGIAGPALDLARAIGGARRRGRRRLWRRGLRARVETRSIRKLAGDILIEPNTVFTVLPLQQ